jgi:hypothetical protein
VFNSVPLGAGFCVVSFFGVAAGFVFFGDGDGFVSGGFVGVGFSGVVGVGFTFAAGVCCC